MGSSSSKVQDECAQSPDHSRNRTSPHHTRAAKFTDRLSLSARLQLSNSNNVQRLSLDFAFARPIPTPPSFRFVDLPTEIRIMIYEEVLVVGKVFFTPNKHDMCNGKRCLNHKLFPKPELQLLRVCKQIHSEAEPIYLSKNLFVLPVRWTKFEPIISSYKLARDMGTNSAESNTRYLFSTAGFSHIRNISVAFDKELCELPYGNFDFWKMCTSSFQSLANERVYEILHNRAIAEVDSWTCTLDEVCRSNFRLQHLEADFTNAFCPLGHCRPISHAVGNWLWTPDLTSIHVLGLDGTRERTELITAARNKAQMSHRDLRKECGLRFRKPGEVTSWDEWMMEGDLDEQGKEYSRHHQPQS